ncbi:MAG: hypothetical protein M3Y41_16320, partial [Pseudomonadota bacterium]|nr:hypothetical protein [Pseudomonadota bacterium]
MISITDVPSLPAAWQDAAVFWHYRPFCKLGLPLRAPRSGDWSREAGGTRIAMGAETMAEGALPLPAGLFLRLLLLQVFTAALRGNSAAVEIGPDAASVAAHLGLDMTPPRVRALDEQAERLIA